MNKSAADNLITEYHKKLFGFAIAHLNDIGEAEELAGEIVSEVYSALLRADELVNPDGYIRRIAKNVYARHIARKTLF